MENRLKKNLVVGSGPESALIGERDELLGVFWWVWIHGSVEYQSSGGTQTIPSNIEEYSLHN